MNIEKVNGTDIAVISGEEKIITDTQAALDLIMSVKYETGAAKIHQLPREGAIYGDYSHYTSKPLKDFIYESNRGRDFFFVHTKEEAIEKLKNIL